MHEMRQAMKVREARRHEAAVKTEIHGREQAGKATREILGVENLRERL